ncbi:hypothetical protein [Dyella sp.]|uniref:DUF7210 family protein n=1 Tax=Dyella sp. TaxID=1869338 RepID=UPI0028497747|nr:hypothetical protein [Dyella sp.]MDR3444700.1 hypothetical protein [Dyella sp.]
MRITLDKPHHHAGELRAPGDTLNVNAIDGEWLVLRGVGHRTTPPDLAQHANAILPADAGDEPETHTMSTAVDADATAGVSNHG